MRRRRVWPRPCMVACVTLSHAKGTRTMKIHGLFAFGCVVTLSLPGPCFAHGGQYRGPGDITPPGPGNRDPGSKPPAAPRTGTGPADPRAPTPPGGIPVSPPPTGNPRAPGGGRPVPGQTGNRGIELVDNFTSPDYWWEFNKDPYLRLESSLYRDGPVTGSADIWLGHGLRRSDARDSIAPTRAVIVSDVLPALKKAIDSTENRDIASSCMIAMAKAGTDHPTFRLIDVFQPRLRRDDQEVREIAALALGIAGIAGEAEFRLLRSLVADDAAGRAACGRAEVDERTRAFATYGLGLLVSRGADVALKRLVLEAVRPLLDDPRVRREVAVAAISTLGLLGADPSLPGAVALVDETLQCLERYYRRDLGSGDHLVQAHCPTAIARLIGPDDPRAGRYRDLFAGDLAGEDKNARRSNDLARSCAIALGRLCRPHDAVAPATSPDAAYSKLLLDTCRQHKDEQTRAFALMALGSIGGRHNRDALLRELDKGRSLQKPWAAMALGVLAFRDREARAADRSGDAPDVLIGDSLLHEFRACKDPAQRGAYAIALGLCGARGAGDELRAALLENTHQEALAGHLCIGLALLDDRRSAEDIRRIALGSGRKPDLLRQAAVALGKLGDKEAAETLHRLLAANDTNLAKLAAIAGALGFIGDRRSIAPLVSMLFDRDLGDLSRAFAAVALGGIADTEPL
ncbi:MAG: hypothetical protein FJ265_19980, partial [Planctomycetes bacterium]|nr:hypothetical protein [Planctomycetota bacterium]